MTVEGLHIEWLLMFFVFVSSFLSILQMGSLLNFYGLLVMFMAPATIVPIATIFFLSMNLTKMYLFKENIDWKLTKQLVISSVPGLLLGAFLIGYLPADWARRIVSLFVILFLVLEIFKIKTMEIKDIKKGIWIVGSVYGFLSGLVGSGGIVRSPLLIKMNLKKEAFIGTAAAASLFSNVIKLGSYASGGLLTSYVLVNGFCSILVGVVGTKLGKYALRYVSESHFNVIVRVGLLISAVTGLR